MFTFAAHLEPTKGRQAVRKVQFSAYICNMPYNIHLTTLFCGTQCIFILVFSTFHTRCRSFCWLKSRRNFNQDLSIARVKGTGIVVFGKLGKGAAKGQEGGFLSHN